MNELEVGEAQEPERTNKPRPAHATQDQGTDEPRIKQQREATEVLRKRFLEAGASFYYRTAPGEPKKIAFTDHGKRLSTEHDDPSVIQGMVLRAQEKGWTVVRVNGTEEFKAEAWVHATLAGLDVAGYTPRAIDLARWQDRTDQRSMDRPAPKQCGKRVDRPEGTAPAALKEQPEPAVSAGQQVALTTLEAILRARGDSPIMMAAAIEEAKARLQGERVVVGTVVDHCIAHYEHDVQKQKSYVVKVATAHGEREIWGIDLARACEQHGVKRGDAVALVQQGQERVTVSAPLRDESGASGGTASEPTHRNRWEIVKLDSIGISKQHELKEAARVSRQEPVVLRYDQAAARMDRIPETARTPAYERTKGGR